jgi:GntR family transcriptional regulator, histidine utilization repressor
MKTSSSGVAVSLHQTILSDIEKRILSGRWPPGHRIPSEIELTEQYSCSRMTVNKVLTQLVHAGMLERRRKAGSFVIRPLSSSVVLEIHDIRAEVTSIGQPYRFEILERRKRKSTQADTALLELDKAINVLELVTLHHAGPVPFCLEERIISLATVPKAVDQTFAEDPPGSWLRHHVPWTSAEHRIRAASTDVESATLLKLKRGASCLVIERRTWMGGKPVTFVRLTYPGESHELVARFSPPTVTIA